MKNLFLGLVATVLMSASAFASTGNATGDAVKNTVTAMASEGKEITKISIEMNGMANGEKVTLTFDNTEALEKFDFGTLDFPAEDTCEVTATVTVSVTVSAGIGVVGGEVTTSVSASVTASCETIGAAVKKLAKSLKDSIT